jgi:hypothetical protein
VFHFFEGGRFRPIALGEHNADGYRIDGTLGQDEAPFRRGRLVDAEGR